MRNNLLLDKKPNFEREKVSTPNAIIDLKVNTNYSHRLENDYSIKYPMDRRIKSAKIGGIMRKKEFRN